MFQCRFGCKAPAIARYATPQGCICFPDDREQDLCSQHIVKFPDEYPATLIKIYDEEVAKELNL